MGIFSISSPAIPLATVFCVLAPISLQFPSFLRLQIELIELNPAFSHQVLEKGGINQGTEVGAPLGMGANPTEEALIFELIDEIQRIRSSSPADEYDRECC